MSEFKHRHNFKEHGRCFNCGMKKDGFYYAVSCYQQGTITKERLERNFYCKKPEL